MLIILLGYARIMNPSLMPTVQCPLALSNLTIAIYSPDYGIEWPRKARSQAANLSWP